MSTERRPTMRSLHGEGRLRLAHLWGPVFALVLTMLGSRTAFAAGCQNSPVLFSFNGSLFTASPGREPAKIASGFKSPTNITWAPGCEHYAFIDSGSLWIGALGIKPRIVNIPGKVRRHIENGLPGYRWSPKGEAIAVTVWTRGCERQPGAGELLDEGNTYVANAPSFMVKALTHDCKSSVIGWSNNSKLVAISKQVLPPCAVSEPICATANIVAVDPRTRSRATMVKARYLRLKGLDFPNVVRWNTQSGIVYVWGATSQIGGLGALLAVRIPSGEILWSTESYGATVLRDGRIANLDRKVTDLEKTGFNWEWQYGIVKDGRVVEEYAPQPTSGGGEQGVISPSGRFVWWQPQGLLSEVRFGTVADADIWGQRLPPGFQSEDGVWTPSDHLIVQAYKKTKRRGLLLIVLLFNPGKKTSVKLFESSYPLPTDPYEDFTQYSAVRLPNGELKTLHKPLVLTRWSW